MSHPSGNPSAFLDNLEPILGQSGCIKSSKDLPKFLMVMKESKMMVGRCLLLNVLKATRAPSILQKFVDSEGWHLLNVWLAEYKKTQNIAVILEMIEVLQKLPVTVDALKKGTMGKLVKQLSKHENSEIKTIASELLGTWMALFGKSKGPTSESGEDGGHETGKHPPDQTKTTSAKSRKRKEATKKDEKPPIEATPPGPLVALGQPRQHTMKRPRDIALGSASSKQLTSPPAQDDKGSPLMSPASKNKGPTESLGFMNALSSQVHPQKVRKVKKVVRTLPNTKVARQSRLSSEDDAEHKPMDESTSNSTVTTDQKEEQVANDDDNDDGPPKPKKKRVSWAPEDQLTDIMYFEPDESERVIRGSGNFLDAAAREKLLERQTMEAAKRSNDRMEEQIQWRRPRILENITQLVPVGSESQEKKVQADREQRVLCQLFFSRESLPPTPNEPDQESHHDDKDPVVIPLYEPGQEPHSEVSGPTGPMSDPHDLHHFPPTVMPHGMGGPPPHNGGMIGPPYGPQVPMQGPMRYRGPPPGHMGGPPPGGRPMMQPHPHMPHPEDGPYWPRGRGWNARPSAPQVCRHFIRHGCLRGDSCRFLHPKDQAPSPTP